MMRATTLLVGTMALYGCKNSTPIKSPVMRRFMQSEPHNLSSRNKAALEAWFSERPQLTSDIVKLCAQLPVVAKGPFEFNAEDDICKASEAVIRRVR
jgi:hypothetical protein